MIASTVSIPAQESSDEDGGEWELLVGKVKDWLEQNDLAELWTKAQLPLRVVGGLIVFSLVATVYNGVLSTINSIPLVPGLLELARRDLAGELRPAQPDPQQRSGQVHPKRPLHLDPRDGSIKLSRSSRLVA